jgi:hypothetical protein
LTITTGRPSPPGKPESGLSPGAALAETPKPASPETLKPKVNKTVIILFFRIHKV